MSGERETGVAVRKASWREREGERGGGIDREEDRRIIELLETKGIVSLIT
jgi:hypothetical protein